MLQQAFPAVLHSPPDYLLWRSVFWRSHIWRTLFWRKLRVRIRVLRTEEMEEVCLCLTQPIEMCDHVPGGPLTLLVPEVTVEELAAVEGPLEDITLVTTLEGQVEAVDKFPDNNAGEYRD